MSGYVTVISILNCNLFNLSYIDSHDHLYWQPFL
jgi:hypothetical protein